MSHMKDKSIELQQYEKEKEAHDTFIRGYKACIKDAERLGFAVDSIPMKALNAELSMRESMDAPNPPGYYRANND